MTDGINSTGQPEKLDHSGDVSSFLPFIIKEFPNEALHLNSLPNLHKTLESDGAEYKSQTKESSDPYQESVIIQLSPTSYTSLSSVNPDDKNSFHNKPFEILQETNTTESSLFASTTCDNLASNNTPTKYHYLPSELSEPTSRLGARSSNSTHLRTTPISQTPNLYPQQQGSDVITLDAVDDTYLPESSLLAAANSGKLAKPSRFPPLTVENITRLREKATASSNPLELLEFAMFLVEAAPHVYADEGDQRITQKRRNSLLHEAQKIVKRLAANANIAKSGCSEAQFFLANCYGTGVMKTPIDPEKAFNFYLQGSKQNHLQCCYRVAVCYEIGTGTKRDNNRAIQFYRKAAKLGDPLSMYKLGMILLNGFLGVHKNEREGVSWIRRAAQSADQDHPQALHELGVIYEQTNIVYILPDIDYSRELFTQAAQYGFAPSQRRLGLAYENGSLNCPINPRRSIAWYSRAAEQGDVESELALSGWYLTGAEGILQQDSFQAYLWARRAADKGFSKAEYAVGYYTETGVGVQESLKEAKRWYLRSASSGNQLAKIRLDNICTPDNETSKQKMKICNSNGKFNAKSRECIIM